MVVEKLSCFEITDFFPSPTVVLHSTVREKSGNFKTRKFFNLVVLILSLL